MNDIKDIFKYDKDTGVFTWNIATGSTKKGKVAGTQTKAGYVQIQYKCKTYLAHRLAWLYVNGEYPIHNIDHIDGNRNNNAISNLRDVPQSVNVKNSSRDKRNKTGHTGIWKDRHGSYSVTVGTQRFGTYRTLDKAIKARAEAIEGKGYSERHGDEK